MRSIRLMEIDKSLIYSKLFDIQDNYNIDISKYIEMIAGSESIPSDILIFINKYYPISQLETYNQIYNRRNSSPLYKNLVNENLPLEERAIALTSLLTQVMIAGKSFTDNDEKLWYYDLMNVKLISDAIYNYSIGNDENLNNVFNMIRDVFKKLFSNEV